MAKDSLSDLQRSTNEERRHPRTVTGRGHRHSTRSPEGKCEKLPQDLEDTQHSDGTDWHRCLSVWKRQEGGCGCSSKGEAKTGGGELRPCGGGQLV